MNEALYKFKNSEAIKFIQKLLSSKYFPFASAALTLLCYYLGWDIVLFYYISITGILILLLLDDITPIISLFLFMSVSVSLINTPSSSMGTSDYYHRPEIYIQIFIIIGLFISAAIYRLVITVIAKKFKPSPIFYGLCAFAATLFINGFFSDDYNPKNMLYGLIMAACFLVIFSVLKDNISIKTESYEKIAYGFFALSILLVIELIVAYATTEGLFVDGIINRYKLIFGWGVYNTFGVLLVMCIPSVIFLSGKTTFGFVYTLYSFVLFVAVFFSCSRQAMIGSIIIYPFCLIALFIKGKNRITNACILSAAAVAAIILISIFHEFVFKFFKEIFDNIVVDGELNGSGRMKIWREALENFKEFPIFGKGFYVIFSYNTQSGLGFIPHMCHNTLLQLLSSCGLVGIAAYLTHRAQTVISFMKNVTVERAFIAATIGAMLIISLFDNHIFNIFPTIIYSSLIAVLTAGEHKEQLKT